ncbi:MAG: hypothetical protein LJE95_04360 [Acidobacteria bacterium]|nr:hypothetical protein [Acidobacteriota bacterium]
MGHRWVSTAVAVAAIAAVVAGCTCSAAKRTEQNEQPAEEGKVAED